MILTLSVAGLLIMWAGLGLRFWAVWLSLALLLILPLVSLLPRIAVEEAVLTKTLGRPCAEYRTHTKRLVPGLW